MFIGRLVVNVMSRNKKEHGQTIATHATAQGRSLGNPISSGGSLLITYFHQQKWFSAAAGAHLTKTNLVN